MAMYTQGFRAGTRALEISQADKTQNGLLVAENVDLERDGVLRKRPGSDVVSLVRSSDPADMIPTDQMQALYSRDAELILETDRELYARQQCGLAAGETAGTATPAEISDALDAIEVRSSPTQTIDVPLTGSGTAASTRTRLDRVDVPTAPVVITPSGRSVSVELSVAGGIITWTATEGAGTDSAPLTGAVQRIARIDSVAITPTAEFEAEAVRITWVAQNGGAATLEAVTLQLWKTTNPSAPKTPPAFTPAYTTLATLRGTAAGASYESSGGAIAAFESAGTLRVWEFDALGNSQGYVVANPPDDSTAYAVDVSANLFPTDTNGLAVAWASSSDGIAHAAQLKTDDSTVLSQMSYSGILTGSPIQIAIFDGPIISWDIADKTGSQVSGTRMVWRFNPIDTAIRAIDLPAGAAMRMQFIDTPASGAEYDIADASTTDQLYPIRSVQGIAGVLDTQWGQQADTIYGVLTSDTGGFFEALWERTAEVAAILVDAAVFSAALAVSANRLTATWWQADTDLRIRYRTLITDAPIDAAFVIASGIGVVGGVISAAVEFEDAGSTAIMGSATWRDDGQVLSLYVREFDGSIFMERVDGFPEIPAFAAEIQGSLGLGPFRIIFSVKYAETFEVYEVTPTLFVRVSPVQEVRAGGDWATRGTWTRTRLSSDVVRYHGSDNVVSSDAATVLNDQGVPCTFVATEVDGAIGALFDVVTTHNEAQGVIDATGKRPRVSPFDDERLAVTYESATRELSQATWSPGSPLVFTTTGYILQPERAWDQTSFEANSESAVVWAAVDSLSGAGRVAIHMRPDVSVDFDFSFNTPMTVIFDVGVSARPLADGVSVEITWGAIGNVGAGVGNQLYAGIHTINMATQALGSGFTRAYLLPDGTAVMPVAVSVDSRDGVIAECWVEIDGPINRHVEVIDVDSSKGTPLTSWKRCSLVSQLAPLNGSVVGAISLLPTSDTDFDVDVGTFVGGKPYRDGVILLSARTGERVGRVGFGEVEDFAERQLRPPKTGLNIGPGGELVLGWQETDLDIGTARAPLSVLYRWDPAAAHAPAVLDSILVSPHGGYPRMYDGQNVNEHGYQYELPEIVQVTSPAAATTLEAGPYSLALTWEAYDATGKLYRSRPTKAGPFTLVAGDVLNVFYRDLTQTEWPDVRIVAWRTAIIDGSQTAAFYRETEGLAQFPAGTDTAQISLSLPNLELVDRERLDQGEQPGDVLEADPIAVTDWSASANGRIWSRDPRSGGTVRHTVTRREGFGLHWSPGQIVEHNGVGDINALAEMNGRVAMLSALDGSAFYGDGPNETGAGGYSVPAHLTLKIGAESQATLAIIPEGLVYGARRGVPPQLLTGGWTSAPLGSDVAAAFHRDGQTVIAAAYVQESDTLHVFDDGQEGGDTQTLRFHFGSRHWANDTLRQARDSTVLGTGQLAILTIDGRVLLENLSEYASGEIGYISRVRTSWMTAAPGKASTNGNFVAVHIVGSYEGAHGLRLLIRYDYREAVIETAFISAATLAAHALEGREYAYAYNTHGESMRRAISVEVQDLGEPNETWSIEAILVESRVDSAVLAELPDGQQFDAEP